MSERFNEATRGITALQWRVFNALDRDTGLSADEVAQRAELGRWSRRRDTADGEPSWEYLGPDRITARNVCGWLASKGLATLVKGRWYRIVPSENPLTVDDKLPSASASRNVDDEGLMTRSPESAQPVLRNVA